MWVALVQTEIGAQGLFWWFVCNLVARRTALWARMWAVATRSPSLVQWVETRSLMRLDRSDCQPAVLLRHDRDPLALDGACWVLDWLPPFDRHRAHGLTDWTWRAQTGFRQLSAVADESASTFGLPHPSPHVPRGMSGAPVRRLLVPSLPMSRIGRSDSIIGSGS